MSSMQIFVISACAFLGFFIVSTMMGAKKSDRDEENGDPREAKTYGAPKGASRRDRSGERRNASGRGTDEPTMGFHSSARWPTVLGVSSDAPDEQVRSAYRALIQKYHPDKVANLGEEFQVMAEQKSREINEAYAEYNRSIKR
jgi:DnaJ-domain-containing protein 1